ncbi:hypothetical protein ACFQL7_25405 [Halocatena marina]|uniref:Uncharacterized protein n=1 Tax=Halocatena marina TaxID=2934937 RepID=A0ABD5YY47_9EURY
MSLDDIIPSITRRKVIAASAASIGSLVGASGAAQSQGVSLSTKDGQSGRHPKDSGYETTFLDTVYFGDASSEGIASPPQRPRSSKGPSRPRPVPSREKGANSK